MDGGRTRATRVLVLSQDRLGREIAGTSIRAVELARVLARHHDVVLAGVGDDVPVLGGLRCVAYDPQRPRTIRAELEAAEVVVSLQQWPPMMRELERVAARVVFDLYVPQPLEVLTGAPGLREAPHRLLLDFAVDRLVDALRRGDFLMCASEGQRDLWLGAMLASGLIDLGTYRRDPSLRSLLDVVPFGVPEDPPRRGTAPGPRERFDLGESDRIVLWNGGVWPWLDPVTAVRAVGELGRGDVHLVFMGAAPQVPAQRAAELARDEASQLGLLGRAVHFHDGWVPYDERAAWLLEADCALYAHHDHLETRFAFRTRLLDCFWAALPIVCTTGDDLSAEVAAAGAGGTFAPGDVAGAAAALGEVLDRPREHYAVALGRLADAHRWSSVAEPLERFVAAGEARPPARTRSRLGQEARDVGYRAGRRALDLVGLRDWPRV